MPNVITALKYYASSIPTIINHMDLMQIAQVPFQAQTKINVGNHAFFVRDLMDIWTIKEVIPDDCYKTVTI